MRLFGEDEGCGPDDSAKEKGNEAGEEMDIVGIVWCESRRGRGCCASEGEVKEEE